MRLIRLGALGSGWVLALVLALVAQGCGDDGAVRGGDAGGTGGRDAGDDGSAAADGGGGLDTGVAPRDGSSAVDAANGADSGASGDSGAMLGSGECTNDADLAAIEAVDMEQVAEDCGTQCFFGGDGCVADCIEEDTDVSTACAGCFAIPVDCTIENCVPDPCGPGTGDSDECRDCRCGRGDGPNCIEMFVQCSGLPSDDCSM